MPYIYKQAKSAKIVLVFFIKLLKGVILDKHLIENMLSRLRIYPIFFIPTRLIIN